MTDREWEPYMWLPLLPTTRAQRDRGCYSQCTDEETEAEGG